MKRFTKLDITASRVRELFSYDPDEGVLTRVKATRYDFLGVVSGPKVSIDNTHYDTARIIWLHYYGEHPNCLVDHINRDHNDNRIANLRAATYTQNQYNKIQSNKHGYKGVTWRNRKQKPWLSKIRVDGARINLGSFATKEEAAKAYEEACLKYHGAFAQLGSS